MTRMLSLSKAVLLRAAILQAPFYIQNLQLSHESSAQESVRCWVVHKLCVMIC